MKSLNLNITLAQRFRKLLLRAPLLLSQMPTLLMNAWNEEANEKASCASTALGVLAVCSGVASLRFLVVIIGVRFIPDEPPKCYVQETGEFSTSKNSAHSLANATLAEKKRNTSFKERHRTLYWYIIYSTGPSTSVRPTARSRLVKTAAILVARENQSSYFGDSEEHTWSDVTLPPLFQMIVVPTIVVKTIFLRLTDDFSVLSWAATSYRTSSFLRRVGSRILLILLLSLVYLFFLSSDLGREINFSEVPCSKSLFRHSLNVPRKNLDQKPR